MIYVDNLVNSLILWRTVDHKMVLPTTILEKASDLNLPNQMKEFHEATDNQSGQWVGSDGHMMFLADTKHNNRSGLELMDDFIGVPSSEAGGTCFQQKLLETNLAEVQEMRRFFRFVLLQTSIGGAIRYFPYEYHTTVMRLLVGGPEESYFNTFISAKEGLMEYLNRTLKQDICNAFGLDGSVRIEQISQLVGEYAYQKMFEYLKASLKSEEQIKQFELALTNMDDLFSGGEDNE